MIAVVGEPAVNRRSLLTARSSLMVDDQLQQCRDA
jgi:hypothetical protein